MHVHTCMYEMTSGGGIQASIRLRWLSLRSGKVGIVRDLRPTDEDFTFSFWRRFIGASAPSPPCKQQRK